MPASTPVPISEAKAHLSDLARRVRLQHERITLTRNGEPEAVLVSVDDLEGLEMTLEILADSAAAGRILRSWRTALPLAGFLTASRHSAADSREWTWRRCEPTSPGAVTWARDQRAL
jgi:prevent-host-death family protein